MHNQSILCRYLNRKANSNNNIIKKTPCKRQKYYKDKYIVILLLFTGRIDYNSSCLEEVSKTYLPCIVANLG